ncbi:MAG: SusC/RagA family TonB-linked outer membrane protein [Prevotellaceae bacterium]|nr:SusC/RagA family TonB-linked outer membrane protein [Prevotellaceae bacterium]
MRKIFITAIVTFMCALTAHTQSKHAVQGVISDASGTLPGVSVVVKGSNIGVVSDGAGNYSIEIPDGNSVLVFSMLGYRTQEISILSRTVVDVTMEEVAQEFEEIVVIGYGAQKKADLAGNVTSLNVGELRSIPSGNLSQALGGRIAGVSVRSNSGGKPGNEAEVVVGARGTWNSTAPLYVIDGVVRDVTAFNMLNSNDIENFSVLKDASAAAIYGARAANGVVLVNTKKGKSGKPTISYSGSYSVGEPAYEPERETFEQRYYSINAARMEMNGVLGEGLAILADGYHPKYTSIYTNGRDATDGYVDSGVFSDEAYKYYSEHQYNRLKEVYHTPTTMTHSLSVSGGSDNVKYYIGGNMHDETGMFKATGYTKYSVRSNLEASITKNLKATLQVNVSNDINKSALNEDGSAMESRMQTVYYNLSRSSTLAPGILNGKYIVSDLANTNGNKESYSALADGAAGIFERERLNSEYTAGLTWEIPWIKGLTAKATYNRYVRNEYGNAKPRQYEAYSLLRGSDASSEYAKNGGKDPNSNIIVAEFGPYSTRGAMVAWQESYRTKVYQANAQLSYSNVFNGIHAVDGILVYEQTETDGDWHRGKRPGLKVADLPYLDFGGDNRDTWTLTGGASEEGRYSIAGRLAYTFDNRYQASFTFRQDVTSKFGPDMKNKKGFFPAGNVFWRISEEKFVKNSVTWLDNLKLRASVGLTGNDNTAAYQYLSAASIAASGMYWGGASKPGTGVEFSDIGNPAITWEKSLNYNAGIDLSVFKMFNISANIWKKHTYDILGTQNNEVPDTFGAKIADVNYGIVDSWGMDIEVGFNKQINKNVSVWAKGNFSWADNKLVEFAESGVPEHLSKLGKNYDRWASYKSDGIVWDLRPQLDANGNQTTKDYGDGNGAQNMYVVKTSTGNTYVIPQNYFISDKNKYIDNGNYNNLRPGTVFPVDINDDGHFNDQNSDDKGWNIERFNPPYTFGLLLGGSWKGFSLEVFAQGSFGHQNYLKMTNMASRTWDGSNWGFWAGDVYSQAYNPTGKMPIFVNGPADANNANGFWTRNASYVRLKNVTLTYELPQSLLSKLRIAGASVYVSAQNLCFLYNAFKFYDPELTGYINTDSKEKDITNNPNLDTSRIFDSGVAAYPLMRTVTLGVSLNF